MPCSCILDKPQYPQNEEWGPYAWRIFHMLAEKAGQQTSEVMRTDEIRAWPSFMKVLPTIIPCPFCRDHFHQYLAQHPFQLPGQYTQYRSYIRTYFYEFHESVNQRLEKKSFPKELVEDTYKNNAVFNSYFETWERVEMRAIKMGGVGLIQWKEFVKQFRMLRAAIGL